VLDLDIIPVINGYKYIITYHVKEKMRERFGSTVKSGNSVLGNSEVYDILQNATENKAIFNNTAFIARMYSKYGCDQRVKFMQSDNIIFIVVAHKDYENCFVVVTCYDGNSSSKPQLKHRPSKY